MMRSQEITGFTLFWNGTKINGHVPSWQMSVQRKGEWGWSISSISAEQAAAIFELLINSGHPDGPWTVEFPHGVAGALRDNLAARQRNTEARKR